MSAAEPLVMALPKGRILTELRPLMTRAGILPEAAFDDPATRQIQRQPYFAPAIESSGFQMSGAELHLGSTDEIGPPVNLREVTW